MNCPRCGKKFRVANTASSGDTTRVHLRNIVIDSLEWYSDDFVVRQRVCHSCLYTTITVEIEHKDLIAMFDIISKEGLPDKMQKHKPQAKVKKR